MRRTICVFFWLAVILAPVRTPLAQAGPMYWDTSSDAGLQAGNGTWNNNSAETWSDALGGSNPLLRWTSSANDAHFYANGTSAVTVGSGVGANKLVFDGTGYTLGGSRVAVGAGGIVANESATMYGVTLGATQSVTVADGKTLIIQNTTVINDGHTWTKNGEGGVTTPGEIRVNAGGGYTHAAGTLEISGGNGVRVVGGDAGDAVFTQTGGTINGTVPYFIIGASGGSTSGTGHKAVFNMQGGALNVTGTLYSGHASDSVITQTGGAVTAGRLDIASDKGHGEYYLKDGTLTVSGNVGIGYLAATNGTVTQTGGTVTIASSSALQFGAGTGTYHLDGGTLKLANLSFADAAKNLLSFGGGTLEHNGSSELATAIPVELKVGGGIISTPTASAGISLTGPITGDGGLTKTGAGVLTLSGNNSYGGTTVIDGGTLRIGAAGALPTGADVSLANAAGAELDLNGYSQTLGTLDGGGASGGNISLGSATLTVSGGTYAGAISGSGRLTKTGDGTLQLSAAAGSTFTGDIYIDKGEVVVDNNNLPTTRGSVRVGTSSSGTGTLTLSDWSLKTNSYFMLGAGGSIDSVGVLNMSSGQIEVGSTMYLGWKGSGTVNQTGGTVIATNANGIHVATDINGTSGIYNLHGGTLRTPQINIVAGSAQNRTTLLSFDNGGTLENNGSGLMTTAIPVELKAGGGTIHTPGGGADIRLTGSLAGTGTLTKTGAGVLTLSGTSGVYSGNVTVSAGTLRNHRALGGNATVSTGATLEMIDGTISGSVNAFGTVIGTGTISGTTDLRAGAILQPGNGGGSLIAGRINVGSSATGTATVNMNEGTLQSSLFILGAGQTTTSTGVLNISGGQINTPHFYLGWRGNAEVNQTGGTVNVTGSNGIHVTTDYDYLEGIYNLDGGTLRTREINTSFAESNTTMLLSFGGGTLENNGSGLMTTAIPVEFKAGGGTISTPGGGADIRLTGSLTGDGDLTKSGAGTLTLSGAAATYTGAVNVSAGTLLVNTSLADGSGVNVASGATLGGTGTIGGPTLIQGGGSLATGTSVGTLTFLDDLTLANGAIWDWEFIDTSSYDQAVGDNGAKLILPTAGSTPAITLNILGEPGHSVDWYDEFTIFDGEVENFDAGLFNLVNDSDWARGWRIFSDGQNLVLTAVPEPGSLVMLAASLLGLLALGYRRRT